MDDNIFKVLDYLDDFVFGSIVDISPVVNRIFPYQQNLSEDDFNKEKNKINRFLYGLEKPKYVFFNIGTRSNIGQYNQKLNNWFSGFELEVLITDLGLEAISREKFNRSVKRNSRGQTWILGIALFISLLSIIISYYNYEATLKEKKNEIQYLLPSKELLEILQREQQIKLPDSTRQEYLRKKKNDSHVSKTNPPNIKK